MASQSRSQAASGRSAQRDPGRVHAPPDDLRPAAISAEGLDLSSAENQSLLAHSAWLEGCLAVLQPGLATRCLAIPDSSFFLACCISMAASVSMSDSANCRPLMRIP